MSALYLPTELLTAGRPTDFPAGSLVFIAPQASKGAPLVQAVRVDWSQEGRLQKLIFVLESDGDAVRAMSPSHGRQVSA